MLLSKIGGGLAWGGLALIWVVIVLVVVFAVKVPSLVLIIDVLGVLPVGIGLGIGGFLSAPKDEQVRARRR